MSHWHIDFHVPHDPSGCAARLAAPNGGDHDIDTRCHTPHRAAALCT